MNKAELIEKMRNAQSHALNMSRRYARDIDTRKEADFFESREIAWSEAIALAKQLTEPQWVNVDERLPERMASGPISERVFVTVEGEDGTRFVVSDKYDHIDNQWLYSRPPHFKVIGWQAIPEPMK